MYIVAATANLKNRKCVKLYSSIWATFPTSFLVINIISSSVVFIVSFKLASHIISLIEEAFSEVLENIKQVSYDGMAHPSDDEDNGLHDHYSGGEIDMLAHNTLLADWLEHLHATAKWTNYKSVESPLSFSTVKLTLFLVV